MSELELLRVARQAVEEGLISSNDYDVVKVAFLRAQQIKAGLDAGFIRSTDHEKARDAYLSALDFSIMATLPSSGTLAAPVLRASGSFDSAQSNGNAAVGPSQGSGGGGGGGGFCPPPAPAAAAAPPAPRSRVPSSAAATGGSLDGGGGGGGAVSRGTSGSGGSRGGGGGGGGPSPDVAALMADVPVYSRGATPGKFSMAGIGLSEDCVNLFMHMKTRSAFKWITFRVDDSGKTVVPDRLGGKASPYSEFVAALPPSDCRYGGEAAPESAPIKTKMMYAATKDFFKGFLDGTGAELQANEAADVSEEEIRSRVVTNLTRK
ncbi:hypothetical protein Rsub_10287 [Raphidocelis subcapitata]|uniref:ADF-H domain-containing protein n=1 Tax=Raphidocelis subcapitata TaxID=307507 RepID=A0A2V0PEW1_9CHLO|nr:hypothetical protein Rsub_10287 [Raphidocelis subcapitata]|eukprot:GBF98059.1 hypothetical protein Rsub_10287 [Raphidocelis subcapitata]